MRTLVCLAIFASVPSMSQSLPDAPSALAFAPAQAPGSLANAAAATSADAPNPLPLVYGRHYRPLTERERLGVFGKTFISPGTFGSVIYSATYRQIRERPAPEYWDTDAEGYGKRFGAAYGQRIINAGTRYTFGALLHEDNRYLICHGCTIRQKIKNALLADFTARHGQDGHKTFSPTGIASGFSGSLVAYAFWYPNQDPRFTVPRGATNAIYGFGTRPASHFAAELLDGRNIKFLSRFFGDNPKRKQQVPVDWTGPMPPKRRLNTAQSDTPTGYAEAAAPAVSTKK